MSADVGSGHHHSKEIANIKDDKKHEGDAHHGIQDTHHLTRQGNRIDLSIPYNNKGENGHLSAMKREQL